jgi:hypothetical protein
VVHGVKMRTLYLSGPMTGLPDLNFPAFDACAEKWRARGWRVISPAEEDIRLGGPEEHPNDLIIRRDVELIMGLHADRDIVVTLPGWFSSLGARAEVALAQWRGLAVVEDQDVV